MLPLGCGPWRAPTAYPAGSRPVVGYDCTVQSCRLRLPVSAHNSLGAARARACFLLVSYTASLAGLCELVLSPHTVLDAVRIDRLVQEKLRQLLQLRTVQAERRDDGAAVHREVDGASPVEPRGLDRGKTFRGIGTRARPVL